MAGGTLIDEVTFTFNSLSKGDYGSSYGASTGIINFEEMQINVHSVDNDEEYRRGNNQVWIKEEYVNSFSGITELSEEDYVVQETSDDELKEKYDNSVLKKLKDKFGKEAFSFYNYDADVDKSKEGVITTNRGIQLGSTKQMVMKSYGIDETNFFDKNTDELYKVVDDDWKNAMDTECDEFLKYNIKDLGYIMFYFNEQDEVVLINYCIR